MPEQRGGRSIGNYLLSKTIGEGTFGKVKLGVHLLTVSTHVTCNNERAGDPHLVGLTAAGLEVC